MNYPFDKNVYNFFKNLYTYIEKNYYETRRLDIP